MDHRRVGRSGLSVSVLGLGLGSFSESDGLDWEAIFEHAVRAGIDLFDTADVYGLGGAERLLGRLVRSRATRGTKRSDLVIATKVASPMGEGANDRGLSRKHLRESIEASLERLQARYVDLYLCHDIDEETPLDETVWTMDQLVREGRCLYWGVSNWPLPWIERALQLCRDRGLCPPIADQSQYNLLNRRMVDSHIEAVTAAGLGFLAWGPLASGVLTGKYHADRSAPGRLATERFAFLRPVLLTDASDRLVAELLARSRNGEGSASALAIAGLLQDPRLTSAILGVANTEQLAENLSALEVRDG
jgi:aryl-alcohol dehydrogenase-like predicted oxidoreductase